MARNDNLSRGERLQIMLSPEELAVVDDFRFKKRMPSRAAAVPNSSGSAWPMPERYPLRREKNLRSSGYSLAATVAAP